MTGSSKSDERNVVLEEHRELTALVARLDEWVAPDATFGPEWGAELNKRVGALVEHLRMHFAGDAEANLFAEVSMSSPHLTGRLTALASEHSEILKAFRRIVDDGGNMPAGDAGLAARLALQTRSAIATLRRHEAEENEIIMRAFWEDLGGHG